MDKNLWAMLSNLQPQEYVPSPMMTNVPPKQDPQQPLAPPTGMMPKLPIKEISYTHTNAPLKYGDQLDQQFYKSINDRESQVGGLQAELEKLKNQETGFKDLNLRPLLAYADSLAGTQTAYAYQAPKSAEQRQEMAQRLQSEINKTQSGVADDQLGYLKMKAQEEQMKIKEARDARAGDKQARNNEFSLRHDWNNDPITKDTKVIAQGFQKIQSGYNSNDPAAFLTMIYGMMKMQDPQSSVKEGEFQTGSNIGGWPQAWQAAYQKAIGDQRGGITQVQKDAILSQAKGIYQSQLDRQEPLNQKFKEMANTYGLNHRNIVMDEVLNPIEDKKTVTPKAGEVHDGYRFKGGNVNDPKNWIAVK